MVQILSMAVHGNCFVMPLIRKNDQRRALKGRKNCWGFLCALFSAHILSAASTRWMFQNYLFLKRHEIEWKDVF